MAVVQGKARSWRESTRSIREYLLQSREAKINGYQRNHNSEPGVAIPYSHCDVLFCLHIRFTVLPIIFWLYKGAVFLCVVHQRPLPLLIQSDIPNLMSDISPRSPLSLSNDSNGSSSNLQNDVSFPHHSAQSSVPAILDGVGPNHSAQSTEPIRSTFSDTLKFVLGSYGSGS